MNKKNNQKEKFFRMMKMVNPELKKEGVGDKYLKSKYGMSDEFDEFEKQYITSITNANDIIYRENDWLILKNPQSIKNLGESIRGVILENGDLFIETYSNVIHNDILKILADKKIIPSTPKKNWTRKLPQESGFLTVQRYKKSPFIAIGESNSVIYDDQNYKQYRNYYDEFLNKARSKMPNLKFVNKLVGTKKIKDKSKTSDNIINENDLKY